MRRHPRIPLALLVAFLLILPSHAHPAPPSLDHLYPVALHAGSNHTVTAIGKFDPWPPKIWVDSPGISFNAETNAGKFTVTIASDATPGPHWIRAFNEQGASGPRFLIVTQDTQTPESEPNDNFKTPQLLESLPASINARLEKTGDVDSFQVALDAGQTLVASVEAYTLASPMDAVLRLLDANGVQVAWNHDDGRTLDPLLAWTAKAAGTYILQVFAFAYPANAEVRFTGGNACVYRLHVSSGPRLRYTLPLGVQRGAHTSLRLVGWNAGKAPDKTWMFDGSSLLPDSQWTTLQTPLFENSLPLPSGEGPELIEPDPPRASDNLLHLDVPSAVTGSIVDPRNQDRFAFTATQGEKLLIELQSASLGFPLDPRLKIEDKNGKELAKKDDGVNSDPIIEFTPPEDGAYVVVIGSVPHQPKPDSLYRLSIRRPVPGLKAVAAIDALNIEPGRTNEVKVTVTRLHGLAAKLKLAAKQLPEGIEAEPVEISEKGGETVLKLVAATNAPPFSGVAELLVTDADSHAEYPVVAELVSATTNNGVPQGFNKLAIETTTQLWLTVLPPPPQPPSPEKKE